MTDTPRGSAARPWVPFSDRYGYRTHLQGLGRDNIADVIREQVDMDAATLMTDKSA